MTAAGALIVIDTLTSPGERGLSESWPISGSMSNAVLRSVWPWSSRYSCRGRWPWVVAVG